MLGSIGRLVSRGTTSSSSVLSQEANLARFSSAGEGKAAATTGKEALEAAEGGKTAASASKNTAATSDATSSTTASGSSSTSSSSSSSSPAAGGGSSGSSSSSSASSTTEVSSGGSGGGGGGGLFATLSLLTLAGIGGVTYSAHTDEGVHSTIKENAPVLLPAIDGLRSSAVDVLPPGWDADSSSSSSSTADGSSSPSDDFKPLIPPPMEHASDRLPALINAESDAATAGGNEQGKEATTSVSNNADATAPGGSDNNGDALKPELAKAVTVGPWVPAAPLNEPTGYVQDGDGVAPKTPAEEDPNTWSGSQVGTPANLSQARAEFLSKLKVKAETKEEIEAHIKELGTLDTIAAAALKDIKSRSYSRDSAEGRVARAEAAVAAMQVEAARLTSMMVGIADSAAASQAAADAKDMDAILLSAEEAMKESLTKKLEAATAALEEDKAKAIQEINAAAKAQVQEKVDEHHATLSEAYARRLAATRKRLETSYNNKVAEVEARQQSKLLTIEGKLRSMEKVLEARSGYEQGSHRVHQVNMAANSINRVLEDPKPFREEWDALAVVGSWDPFVKLAIGSVPPDVPDKGLVTLNQLSTRFDRVAQIARRVSLVPEEGGVGSWFYSQTLSKLKSFPTATLEVKGDETPAVVARAEYHLEEGDLESAVGEVSKLRGEAGAAAQDWLTEAKERLAVAQAVSVITAHTTTIAYTHV